MHSDCKRNNIPLRSNAIEKSFEFAPSIDPPHSPFHQILRISLINIYDSFAQFSKLTIDMFSLGTVPTWKNKHEYRAKKNVTTNNAHFNFAMPSTLITASARSRRLAPVNLPPGYERVRARIAIAARGMCIDALAFFFFAFEVEKARSLGIVGYRVEKVWCEIFFIFSSGAECALWVCTFQASFSGIAGRSDAWMMM